MENDFVQVGNVRRMVEALGQIRTRSDRVPGMGAIIGDAGRGKTASAIWYMANKGGHYMLSNVNWTPLWALNDLYAMLRGLDPYRHFSRTDLAFDAVLRAMRDDPSPILIDEADRIANKMAILETLRDLHDRTATPVIFLGTDIILARLTQHQQLDRRLHRTVMFKALTVEEVQMVAIKLTGLTLDADAAEEMHEKTRGLLGRVVTSLENLERASKHNKTTAPPVELVSRACQQAMKRAA